MNDNRMPRRERPARSRAAPPVLGAIALGGALGAPARYGAAQLIAVSPRGFPWATFWTNISGSFAVGLVLGLLLERFPPSRYLRPFLATGFLGAYTTYSSFSVETVLLAKNGHSGLALGYAAASLVGGLVVAGGGISAARAVPARPGEKARRLEGHRRERK